MVSKKQGRIVHNITLQNITLPIVETLSHRSWSNQHMFQLVFFCTGRWSIAQDVRRWFKEEATSSNLVGWIFICRCIYSDCLIPWGQRVKNILCISYNYMFSTPRKIDSQYLKYSLNSATIVF